MKSKTHLINLIKSGRLVINYTPKDKIPYPVFDGDPVCDSVIKNYGFKDIWEFEEWYNKIYHR